ncbi:DUF4340 domain-containing protein, partial [Myxococcota bacterium]
VVKQVYSSTFSRESATWLERKLFDAKLADVKRIEVSLQGQPPFALVKADNKWDLEDKSVLPGGFRFDKNGASSLASTLVNARAKDILDEDPGVEKTQIDKADSFAFVVEEGEGEGKSTVRRELRLGGPLEDKTVYAKVGGKEDVITLPEYTAKNLRKAPTDFRDLKMMDFDPAKVTKVAIRDAGLRLTLERQGAEWKIAESSDKIPDDFTLDPGMVVRRLSALANTRAAKVAEGVSAGLAGLGRPGASVTATLEDSKTVTVAFGNEIKEDNRDLIYARGNADNAVYLVTKWTRQNLAGGLKTFKKTADPSGMSNIDPKALQNLPPDVRAGLMKQMQQKQRTQKMMERFQRQAEKKAKAKTEGAN